MQIVDQIAHALHEGEMGDNTNQEDGSFENGDEDMSEGDEEMSVGDSPEDSMTLT